MSGSAMDRVKILIRSLINDRIVSDHDSSDSCIT